LNIEETITADFLRWRGRRRRRKLFMRIQSNTALIGPEFGTQAGTDAQTPIGIEFGTPAGSRLDSRPGTHVDMPIGAQFATPAAYNSGHKEET
jgi:hypothetical protein